MTAVQRYNDWCKRAHDPEIAAELAKIAGNASEINERFYGDLEFGTAGLRGILGAGSARMNLYTVGRATQGFAEYLRDRYSDPWVAISFDSRIKSFEFSRLAASIFVANGVGVYLFEKLQPTPVLAFTVRDLRLAGGVMVTASHNPSAYNGYKAYGDDGCQLSVADAESVTNYIDKVDPFEGVKTADISEAVEKGRIVYLGDPQVNHFLDVVIASAVHPGICADSGLRVTYSPLNGTGKVPVCRLFKRIGVSAELVASQAEPDGNFPTCPYPNPEFREALEEGLKTARASSSDILIATDPDADRVGTAVRTPDGDYKLITGNEMGCLLYDYLFSQLIATKKMPSRPVAVKTIVTTTMADAIGAHYGVEIRSVFTGFKFICAVAAELEEAGEGERYLMGFEESYGYCIGKHVRDKDAVVTSMFICEMAAFYKKNGSSILQRLNELYEQYGCYSCKQQSLVFPGVSGMKTRENIMDRLRENPPREMAGFAVTEYTDYEAQTATDTKTGASRATGLEPSDVVAYLFEDGSKVVIRPSGTEPKLKLYYLIKKPDSAAAEAATKSYFDAFSALIDSLK